ncbi:MAG TPA: DUF1684 domain-containing protein [Cyclobacteriaceae bacterium]|nr:DUF1684 domain-containing protein [Cyclobacteriaceae bacterium]
MRPKNIFVILFVIAVIIILYSTLSGNKSQEEYNQQIQTDREDKDRFMKTSAESPFASQPETFEGLKYFPPDEKYRVIAKLIPAEEKKVQVLSTNDGKDQSYLEYAYAEFDLDNRKNRLLILEVMETGTNRGSLFLAFGDKTSANETYGAGRYLDIKKVPGASTIELDFNKAYNPYCAYTDRYSCPFPPKENLLDISILAGEKTYK